MSKVQEQNQAVQSLTLDKHHLKMQVKEYAAKNHDLEHMLEGGEVKLRYLARQLTKSVEEQERLIRVEGELRMKLRSKTD
jgi:hypothetical protein